MGRANLSNTYKDIYLSEGAKSQLEELLNGFEQGNLAFYSDIRVSLNRIAGGEYEGIKYIGDHTWKKDLEFGGGCYYLSLICDSTYRKVAFYITRFEFDPSTSNRKIVLKESTLRKIIRETIINVLYS